MNNGSVAPTCPVSRSQAVAGQPSAQVQIVPATDLPSAIVALQQISLIMQKLSPNNVAPKPLFESPSSANQDGGNPQDRREPGWDEVERTAIKVRLLNPDDPTVGVTLQHITFLHFIERKTHVTLEWFMF